MDISQIYNISFFFGLILVSLSILLSWNAIKTCASVKNIRPLLFGSGVLVAVFSFFMTDITRIFEYPLWLYVMVTVGYVLIAAAFVRKRRDYFIFSTLLLLAIIPVDSIWFSLVTIPVLWIATLAYKNFSTMCSKKNNKLQSYCWSAVITIFAFLSLTYFFAGRSYPTEIIKIVLLSNIVLKIAVVSIMGFLAYKYLKLVKKEMVIVSIIISFIVVSSLTIYITSLLINSFIQNEYKDDVTDSAKIFVYAAQEQFPKDTLAKKIIERSSDLNDFADKVYVETGIRGTFFLSNIRIASAPSAINGKRNINTTIEDKNVKDKVLKKGEIYAGTVLKENRIIVAAYIPVQKDGKIIGMVAVGKLLTSYEQTKHVVTRSIILEGLLSVAIVIGAVFIDSRKKLNTR